MMNIHKSFKHMPLAAAVVTALGLSAVAPVAHAATLANGDYTIYINPTPYNTSLGRYEVGSAGAWNSSFTFGGGVPTNQGAKGSASQSMGDNGNNRNSSTGGVSALGSGVLGDGWAGRVGIRVSGGTTISVTSFSKDIIWNTAGGDFTQYYSGQSPGSLGGATITGSGSVDASGNISLLMANADTNVGRLGAIFNPVIIGARWNFDDVCQLNGVGWAGSTFTTGSVSTPLGGSGGCGINKTITGSALSCGGDINGDSVNDCTAILVSGGSIGGDWGGFQGAQYFEVWNVQIRSAVIQPVNTSTAFNTPITVTVPPTGSTGITPLTVTSETKSCSNGSVAVSSSSATYTPNSTFAGTDTCTYTVTDGNGEAKTGTINITVNSAGTPSAVADPTPTTKMNTAVVIDVLSNDTATSGTSLDPATVTIVSAPSNGATSINTSTGAVTYTPTSGFVGTDTFTYNVKNNVTPTAATSNTATVTVTVSPWGLTSNGTYALGTLATSKNPNGPGTVTSTDVQADSGGIASCVGGSCFDFKITSVTVGSVNVVLPKLSSAFTAQNVTDGLRYRKYINGAWAAFDTTSDSVASAPATSGGGCPLPGAGSWKTWTNAAADSADVGDQCIRLTITDNGANDSDAATGTIADPSGAATGTATTTVVTTPDSLNSFGSSSQGCSISPVALKSTAGGEWWLVGGFLVWLRALLWRRKKVGGINQA